MSFTLGPQARAAGFTLHSFDAIGSTNAEALALARSGATGGAWFAARRQTAGRGRRGRAWETASGNLAATILTVTEAPGSLAATLGFVGGLALERALGELAPDLTVGLAMDAAGNPGGDHVRFRLKWPNDVVVAGGKLAGILLEAEKLPDGRLAIATGIGVNVRTAPADTPYAAVALADLGVETSAEALFIELAEAWVGFHRLWDEGRGLPAIRRLWLDVASGLGEPVAVRAAGEVLRGVFETIDDEGRLVVRRGDGGLVRISAGEVHFGAAASAAAAAG